MQMIRAFIAIQLPEEVRTYLGNVSRNSTIDLPAGAVRWVKPELMHLTIRFLGDTSQERIGAIKSALDEAAAAQPCFNLQLDRLGCFPNKSRPRVIWAGISGATDAARTLKGAIDAALARLGWAPEDKAFRAHLTLGRVKHSNNEVRLPWGQALDPLAIPVSAVHLLRSELFPSGPVYTALHSTVLLPSLESCSPTS